jgi:hypothetical protein
MALPYGDEGWANCVELKESLCFPLDSSEALPIPSWSCASHVNFHYFQNMLSPFKMHQCTDPNWKDYCLELPKLKFLMGIFQRRIMHTQAYSLLGKVMLPGLEEKNGREHCALRTYRYMHKLYKWTLETKQTTEWSYWPIGKSFKMDNNYKMLMIEKKKCHKPNQLANKPQSKNKELT